MRKAAMKAAVLLFACAALLHAAEQGSDSLVPSAKDFSEFWPPADKGAGTEVVVQVLDVRERGRAEPWPEAPLSQWLEGDGVRSVPAKLNLVVTTERLTSIKTGPAGVVLAAPCSTGWILFLRPDETEDPGLYSIKCFSTFLSLSGWTEAGGVPLPLRKSSSARLQWRVNNRWFLVASGESAPPSAPGEKDAEQAALYVRVEDGSAPAATVIKVREALPAAKPGRQTSR